MTPDGGSVKETAAGEVVVSPRERFLAAWRNDRDIAGTAPELLVQPFPGLRSFWQDESDLFFGRERQFSDLLAGFATRNVTFVLGGSGSGKSSLIRAGVLPRLNTATVHPRAGAWYALDFRPGESPSSHLFAALVEQIIGPVLALPDDCSDALRAHRYDALEQAIRVEIQGLGLDEAREACRNALQERLYRKGVIDIPALIEFAKGPLQHLDWALSHGAQSAPPNLFLLIDQFEEVFATKVHPSERDMLLSLITTVWRERPERLYLVVTMRSEELHRCSEFESVSEVINSSMYFVNLVSENDLVEAIVGPAKRVMKAWGLEFSAPFTQNAIAFLQKTYRDSTTSASSADRLPLMQHLLTLVWNRAVQRWSEETTSVRLTIDVQDILAIDGWSDRDGPLRGCLSAHADWVLKQACEAAAKLVPPDGDSPPSGTAERLLRASFCTLATHDDRGNPKRAFARVGDMLKVSGVAERERERTKRHNQSSLALNAALEYFLRSSLIGVLAEEGSKKINVNHEAFVRGWKKYGEWLRHASRCENGLIGVDQQVRPSPVRQSNAAGSVSPKSVSLKIAGFIFAERLRAADAIVTDDTARLLDDVLGPQSVFSSAWAEQVLAQNDALEAAASGGIS
jgi:hypothetical protein